MMAPKPSSSSLAAAASSLAGPAAGAPLRRGRLPKPLLGAASSSASRRPTRSARSQAPSSQHSFHTSRPSRNAPPKSPFQAFVDTLREELKKSQEMQDNMKQLQGDVGKMQDSETMRKMRDAYERARIVTSIKDNPRLQKAAEQLKKSGGQVGDAVSATLKQMEESEIIKGLGAISSRLAQSLADSTAPVRDTAAYKAFSQTLQEAFDDGGSALRIHADKDADAAAVRRLKRETRLRKIGRPPPSADVDVPIDETVAATGAEAEASSAAEDPIQAAAAAGAAAGAEGARKAAAEGASAGETSSAGESAKGKEAEAGASAQPRPAASQRRPAGYAVRVRGTQENSEAGSALVLRPEPAYKRAWSDFNERNPLMRKLSEMRSAYDESENPFVERLRGVTETIGSWFDENETAQVVRAFRTLDPSFTLENFQRDLREYIVPELIDAYHAAQRHLLRQWCGEATYNVLMATIDPYIQRGMISEGKLLDVRNIDIVQGKMLENNVPVLVVSFSSQELVLFRDIKTGEVKVGAEDQVEMCRYAMVLTRDEKELDNEITGGWKVVELARRGQAAYL